MKFKGFLSKQKIEVLILFVTGAAIVVGGTFRLLGGLMRALTTSNTELPTYHIEGWTMAALANIRQGLAIYGPIESYQSPIYQPLPYYFLSILVRPISPLGLSDIGGVRALSFLLPLAGIMTFGWISYRALQSAPFWQRISFLTIVALAVASPVVSVNHIGLGFPHEFTKFFLAVLAFVVILFSTRDRLSRQNWAVLAIVLGLSPWIRQTYLLITAPMLLLFLYRDLKQKNSQYLTGIACFIGINVLTLAFVLAKNPVTELLAWTLSIPGQHDRGLIWMPSNMFRLCMSSLFVYGFFVFLVRKQLSIFQTILLLVFGVLGAATGLFHSMKQGSGTHMADTIVYPMCAMFALALAYRYLQQRSLKSLYPVALGLFAWIAINDLHTLKIIGNPPSFGNLRQNIERIQNEKKEIYQYVGGKNIVSITGPIESLPYDPRTPLETSMLETSYTNPKKDGAAKVRMKELLGSDQIILSNLDNRDYLYLPDSCHIAAERQFPEHRIWAFTVTCSN